MIMKFKKSDKMENENKKEIDIKSFASAELEALEAEKQKFLKEKGYAPFYKFEEGATDIEVLPLPVRDNKVYAGQKIFRIKVQDKEYDLSVPTKNPLYSKILKKLSEGITKMQVLRVGLGKNDTKYSVK